MANVLDYDTSESNVELQSNHCILLRANNLAKDMDSLILSAMC